MKTAWRGSNTLLILSPLIFLLACQEERYVTEQRPYEGTINEAVQKMWQPDTAYIQHQLDSFFTTHQVGDSFQIEQHTFQVTAVMAEVYRQHRYEPLWLDQHQFASLITLLRSSEYDGLLPADYHWLELKQKQLDFREGKLNDSTYVYTELMATASFLSYAHDMWRGKVDPFKIYPEWNYETRAVPENASLELLNVLQGPLEEIAARLRPQAPVYAKLRKSFQRLDSLERRGLPWPTITYPGFDLKAGDTLCTVMEVKIRFRNMGIYEGDTSVLFNNEMVESVKHFQRLINVPQSGKLDKATVARLNFTLEEVRNTIRVNMERCRWLLHDLPDYYVVVNIASYTLQVVDKGKAVYNTKVIVGREQTRTPVFQANLTQIIFNPDWTLPRSIIEKETLPALQKNPNYLATHHMQLLKGNTAINPATVNFNAYTAKTFPYSIKQLPGEDNALGKVKFIMPNPYSIYLHDTPSRYLFEKDDRAFSHGCIRVYKPIDFSEFLLKASGFDRAWINARLAAGKTYAVNLSQKIPIMLTYWTCYEDKTLGGLQFFPDIYGRDMEILRELNN